MRYNTAYAGSGISGDPAPSEADVKVTRDLIRAGHLLKIEVIDHIIIGRATAERAKDYSSLRELGYFYAYGLSEGGSCLWRLIGITIFESSRWPLHHNLAPRRDRRHSLRR